MIPMQIKILDPGDPGPAFPELTSDTIHAITHCVIIGHGTTGGKAAVAFACKDASGKAIVMQTTEALFEAACSALQGAKMKWEGQKPAPNADNPKFHRFDGEEHDQK